MMAALCHLLLVSSIGSVAAVRQDINLNDVVLQVQSFNNVSLGEQSLANARVQSLHHGKTRHRASSEEYAPRALLEYQISAHHSKEAKAVKLPQLDTLPAKHDNTGFLIGSIVIVIELGVLSAFSCWMLWSQHRAQVTEREASGASHGVNLPASSSVEPPPDQSGVKAAVEPGSLMARLSKAFQKCDVQVPRIDSEGSTAFDSDSPSSEDDDGDDDTDGPRKFSGQLSKETLEHLKETISVATNGSSLSAFGIPYDGCKEQLQMNEDGFEEQLQKNKDGFKEQVQIHD